MFDTVCSLPLSSDLFAQAIHPNEPIVSVGLATGHVQTFRLPSEEADSEDDGASTSSARNGTGHIDTMWRTRRHKGSCRCLGFGTDGEAIYSSGTDGLVKVANTKTGQVENKIAIPLENNGYAIIMRRRRVLESYVQLTRLLNLQLYRFPHRHSRAFPSDSVACHRLQRIAPL